MKTVELIYFQGCPNISLARERLLQAFAKTGMTPQWREWERNDPASPAYARAYGSPTILVNGQDVTGMEPSDEAAACRIYTGASATSAGAPGVNVIAAKLMEVNTTLPPRANWRGSFAALPAIGAVALPKLACPACWPAYAGFLSSMGVGFVNYTPYLLPLTAMFLLLSLIALGWRARLRRGYGPLLVGLAASAVILTGKFAFDSDPAMYAGIALLIAATVWNAWPRARQAAVSCPACLPANTIR